MSSYSYMGKHLDLLMSLTSRIQFCNDLSMQELLYFHNGISVNFTYFKLSLLQDEDQYKKNILLKVNSFIEFEGKVRDFTLDFLKNYYPLYYDSAQNGIKVFAEIVQTEKNIEQITKNFEEAKEKIKNKSLK